MRTTHCKLSALLVLSLVPYTAVAQADESIKRQQVCQVGDGETCKDSFNLLDEGLSLIQHRMSVSEHTESNGKDVSNLVQAAISMYRENGNKVTPAVQTFLKKVLAQIDDVLGAVDRASGTDQSLIDTHSGYISDALSAWASDVSANDKLKTQADTARTTLKGCRDGQKTIYDEYTRLKGIFEAKKAALEGTLMELKDHFAAASALSDPDAQKQLMLRPEFRARLVALLGTFSTQNAEYDAANGEYKTIVGKLGEKKEACDQFQGGFEAATCKYAVEGGKSVQEIVAVFETAYDKAAGQYGTTKSSVEKLVADREVEYTGLTHAKCMLNAITGKGALTEEGIKKCQNADVDLSSLKITYPPVPAKPTLPSVPPHPCNADFKSNEYSYLAGTGVDAATCKACSGGGGPIVMR